MKKMSSMKNFFSRYEKLKWKIKRSKQNMKKNALEITTLLYYVIERLLIYIYNFIEENGIIIEFFIKLLFDGIYSSNKKKRNRK